MTAVIIVVLVAILAMLIWVGIRLNASLGVVLRRLDETTDEDDASRIRVRAHLVLAGAYLVDGQTDVALAQVRKALGVLECDSARIDLAMILAYTGQVASARELLEDVLADDPMNTDCQRMLDLLPE